MLEKQIFLKCFFGLLTMNDIKPDDEKTKMFYDLMKNDFTDGEFQVVCERICKEETLYNKYPTPSMFYKYKTSRNDVRDIECQKFLDKVEYYLNLGFVPTSWKQEFIDGLSDSEKRAMQGFGGISTLWSDCHREERPRSITNILKDLRESFENCCRIEEKVDAPLIEQQSNPEIQEKTMFLLKNCFKKIGD